MFSFLAFFEVRGSIHSAVDEGLRDRAADIRELLERQWPPEQVKRELAAGSSVRGEDDILEIAETRGEWAYDSVSALHYGLHLGRSGKPGEKIPVFDRVFEAYAAKNPERTTPCGGQILRCADRRSDG
jgi:hypothetical protein